MVRYLRRNPHEMLKEPSEALTCSNSLSTFGNETARRSTRGFHFGSEADEDSECMEGNHQSRLRSLWSLLSCRSICEKKSDPYGKFRNADDSVHAILQKRWRGSDIASEGVQSSNRGGSSLSVYTESHDTESYTRTRIRATEED